MILELDALNVVSALNNDSELFSPIGLIFLDCKNFMSCFNNLRIVYTSRSANQVAHLLAKGAGSSTGNGHSLMFDSDLN